MIGILHRWLPAPLDSPRIATTLSGPRDQKPLKAHSRANAVKHGLAGSGVALPTEDAACVQERFLGLQESMAPTDALGMVLGHKLALMSIRGERASRVETVALSLRMRHAAEEFEINRLAEVDRLFKTINTDPGTIRRRLLTSVEGADRLIGALTNVREQLVTNCSKHWDNEDRDHIEAYFGESAQAFPVHRAKALLFILAGNSIWAKPGELRGIIGKNAKREWARAELIKLIDAEAAKFQEIKTKINPEIVEQDRLEAAERVMFDPGADAVLARKYEAAATRAFFRALKDFRENAAMHQESASDADVFFDGDHAPTTEADRKSRIDDVPLEYPKPIPNRHLHEQISPPEAASRGAGADG